MSDGSGGRRGLRRGWWWQRAGWLVIVAGLAVLTAACGSSPSPRPGPGAYSACLRKHGVTGALAAPPPTSLSTSMPTSSRQIPAKAAAAMQACRSLAPQPHRLSGPG
jgi:hypothetical protein